MSKHKHSHCPWALRCMAPAVRALLAAAFLLTPTLVQAETRSVGVERANFRAGPSTSDDVLFSADRHYPVELIEIQGEWAFVRDFEGDEAWIAAWLLSEARCVTVTSSVVNVREKPSTEGRVVHTAERGAAFLVVEEKSSWVKIADEIGEIGWVHQNLLWDGSE